MADRLAFIIGINDYNKDVGVLHYAVNDANGLTEVLKKMDFEVVLSPNPSKREFNNKRSEFIEKCKLEPQVVLFYFSGHGIQLNNKNYLIPKDIETFNDIRYDQNIEDNTIFLDEIINDFEKLDNNPIKIILIDACRDNPFKNAKKKFTILEQTDYTQNTDDLNNAYLVYATSSNKEASDGNETIKNSPFAKALIHHINTVGLKLDDLFKKVKDDVFNETDKNQKVRIHHSYDDETNFCLIEKPRTLNESNEMIHKKITNLIMKNQIKEATDQFYEFANQSKYTEKELFKRIRKWSTGILDIYNDSENNKIPYDDFEKKRAFYKSLGYSLLDTLIGL